MFSVFVPYGYACDPTDERVFSVLPSKADLTAAEKKSINFNYANLSDSDIIGLSKNIFDNYGRFKIDAFNTSFILCLSDKNKFDSDTSRHLSKTRSSKLKNRYFLANSDDYLSKVGKMASLAGKENSDRYDLLKIRDFGINQYIRIVLGGSDYYDREASIGLMDEYKSSATIECEELKRFVFYMQAKLGNIHGNNMVSSFFSMLLELCVSDLEKGDNIVPAVQCLWSISTLRGIPEVFYLTYFYFRKHITPEVFPFLRFSILDFITSPEQLPHTRIEACYSDILVSEVQKVIQINSIGEAHYVLSSLFEKNEAFVNNLLSAKESFAAMKQFILKKLSVFADVAPEVFNSAINKVSGVKLPENARIKSSDISEAQQKSWANAEARLAGCSDCIAKIKSLELLKLDIADIEMDSIELGKAPLDNIEKLTALSIEKKAISKDIDELQKSINESLSRYSEAICDIFDQYVLVFSENKAGSDCREMLSEAMRESEELKSKNLDLVNESHRNIHEINRLGDKIVELEYKLQALREPSLKIETDDSLSALIIKIVQSNCSAEDVLKAVSLIGGERVVFSSSAIRNIDKIDNFKRKNILFEKLLMLTSVDFIKNYNEEGSSKCFEMFTKNELSFQETKATISVHDRTFIVGGVEYDCRAHLKIGSDNTEQNMLRVYFAIDGDRVIIGEITKHLPISRAI